MIQSRAKTVEIAAKIFRLVVQSLRRDVIRRPPNLILRFRILPGCHRQTKIADLRRRFVREKNVARLHVAMNKSLLMRGPQTPCDLNPGIQNLPFIHAPLLRHPVVETSLIHQLHHEIELAVVAARRKNLDDMRIVHRRRGAGFLLEPLDFARIGAQFRSEQLERDESIQPSVARLVN